MTMELFENVGKLQSKHKFKCVRFGRDNTHRNLCPDFFPSQFLPVYIQELPNSKGKEVLGSEVNKHLNALATVSCHSSGFGSF